MRKLILIVLLTLAASVPARLTGQASPRQDSAVKKYGQVPLRFEENRGQTDSRVRYLSRGPGYVLFLTDQDAVLRLQDHAFEKGSKLAVRGHGTEADAHQQSVVRIRLVGENPGTVPVGVDRLSAGTNYFIGNDPSKWRRGVPTFAKVNYSNVYPGVDLIYYGNQGHLEYDFVVSAGADPKAISFGVEGATHLFRNGFGGLEIATGGGMIELGKPSIYQMDGTSRKYVSGEYVIHRKNTVGIRIAKYNPNEPLIIDPVLTYSTYLGGSGVDFINGVVADQDGNAYLGGSTLSTDFPIVGTSISSGTTNGCGFVAKMNSTGTDLVYSTYICGSAGDYPWAIAVDSNGRVYLTGQTTSTDFPVTTSGFQTTMPGLGYYAYLSGFLAEISADGQSLLYSSYLGGSVQEWAAAIAVDGNQNAFIAGVTSSANFPTTPNAVETSFAAPDGMAFVSQIDTTKSGSSSLIYSTLLGGSEPATDCWQGADLAQGVGIGTNRHIYVTGIACTSDFPTTTTAYQTSLTSAEGAFLSEIDPTASGNLGLIYSTVLAGTVPSDGGVCSDGAFSISLDQTNKAYVAGCATAPDFPTTTSVSNSVAGKAFVAKFDTSQSNSASLLYSTLVGGSGGEVVDNWLALAVDPNGNAYVGSVTESSDLPVTADAVQSTLGSGGLDSFLAVLSPDASTILYATYLGGTGGGSQANYGLALDSHSNVYLAGLTSSTDFQVTSGAFQTSLNGSSDGYLTMLSPPTGVASIQVTPQSATLVVGVPQQYSLIATLNDDSMKDVTANASWASSSTSVVTVATLPGAQGNAVGTGTGTATITATLGTLSANATVTVVAPSAPAIASISPTSGSAGTQVTVTGSDFGATQGTGYLWLGSTPGVITTWSDTQIVANVAAISTSGTAQVVQNGAQSNTVSFTVITPTITNASPNSGLPGLQVTITGSGFGASQRQVLLGTLNGIVNSWSDTQIVATAAPGSNSGPAQVLQGGVWSNSVYISIDSLQLCCITPTSGAAGTSVGIGGSGFGASQGTGTVYIGGVPATVTAWSDTGITATVGASAITGVVKVQQSGLWSNALSFTVPPSGGAGTITLVPDNFKMVVGQTASIQAVNSSSQSVTGLTWTSSNTSVVSLSTDDPPILTALATGNSIITAGGVASADVTVVSGSSLPTGSVQWSNPGDGSGVSQIIPAVPSASGVDVFATQNSGNLQAIRTDGTVAWSANLGGNSFLAADFQGGVLISGGYNSFYKLDGATGVPYPSFTSPYSSYPIAAPAIHTDGTIFTTENGCSQNSSNPLLYCPFYNDSTTGSWVVGVNPVSGQTEFSAPAALSTQTTQYNCAVPSYCGTSGTSGNAYPSLTSASEVTPLVIAGDGYAYTAYWTHDIQATDTTPGQQPFPAAVYPIWYQLGQDLLAGGAGPPPYPTIEADFSSLLGQVGLPSWLEGMARDLCAGPYATPCVGGPHNPSYVYGTDYLSGPLQWRLTPITNSTETDTYALHVLRVGSDGSSSDTIVKSWPVTYQSAYSTTPDAPAESYAFSNTEVGAPVLSAGQPSIITNADQGILVSWGYWTSGYCAVANEMGCQTQVGSEAPSPSGSAYHLTTITGGVVVSDVSWSVPGLSPTDNDTPVQPLLQLQNGSFVGVEYPEAGGIEMVNFTPTGSFNWSVDGHYPGMATADGGLIDAPGYTAGGFTFDASGNATGQLASFPIYSWFNLAYQLGSVDQIASVPPILASTFAAIALGNNSANGTAIQQQWYPPLPSCTAVFMVCAGDAVRDTLNSLGQLLSGPCSACQNLVFNHSQLLGDQSQYAQYLSKHPFFFDGSHSTLVMNNFQPGFGIQTVAQYMGTSATAITQTPGRSGRMITFFATTGPAAVCNALGSTFNEGTMFHEMLHAKSGLMDRSLPQPDLLALFGLNDMLSSDQLTFYLIDNVLGGGPHTCGN